MTSNRTILEVRNVTKDFPGVRALDNVSLEVRRGEIHAIVGENGAGKTTLVEIIGGTFKPTAGEVYVDGEKVSFDNVAQALRKGIALVHQEKNLVPYFNAVQNIFLGHEATRGLLLDEVKLRRQAQNLLREMGIDIDLEKPVKYLGVAERQVVEILRVMYLRPKLMILDEPTASLTESEAKRLFQLLRRYREEGMGIIIITHHLDEVFAIADRATVLRNGMRVMTQDISGITHDELVRTMIDRDIKTQYPKEVAPIGGVVLDVEGLVTDRHPGVSFNVRSGEVVGFGGMVGSGRSELMEAIFGSRRILSGKVKLCGAPIRIDSVRDAIAHGIYFIPEDRNEKGLILEFSVKDNLSLSHLDLFSRFLGLLDLKRETASALRVVQEFRVDTPDVVRPVRNLSGGNKQKVCVGRWMHVKGKVFIFDEPTQGIDVGAKVEVYHLMTRILKEGGAIVLVSSDLPELLAMSDRIYVMCEGSIVDEIARSEATSERVLRSALGVASMGGDVAHVAQQ